MAEVRLWIFVGNKLVLASARLDDSLVTFFRGLRNDVDAAEYIPADVSYGGCGFYRLENPASVIGNDSDHDDEYRSDDWNCPDAVKQACLDENNRVSVDPRRIKVRELADVFSAGHVYLVIDFPDPFRKSNEATGELRKNHGALFKCLQVTVRSLGKWWTDDVQRNLQGGILTSNDDTDLPSELREIQEALETKRTYQAVDEQNPDFESALNYRTEFDRIFSPCETEPHTVISDREFSAFYRVLRCYDEDVQMITRNCSSALKASSFTVHFIQPPFFSEIDSSRGFKYHQPKSWSFPIFVDTKSARNIWQKFTPRNDWMVISPDHKIPFVISKVMSQEEESDRSRMLVEAIALARAGQFLLRSTSKRTFFVTAVHVNANMLASRYIVMQTGRGNREHTNKLYHDRAVCIHRKDFDLTNSEEGVDFLREMYNLATQITALSRDMDQLKKESLKDIKHIAEEVMSLSSRYSKMKTDSDSDMDSRTKRRKGGDWSDDDDLGVFEAEDIQNVLRQMDYKIEFIPWGHPELAVIVSETGDKHGYFKFVEREREVDVLRYLTEIESPSNHTISGVQFWPVEGGTAISMPVAGGWLTSLDNPGEELWSVALQLIEAVAFMHEHNVAHMDLKPQNIIIPPEGGRLSIIDFSVSIRVRGRDVKYSGVVGTEDYMAPEVRRPNYKPMLADLWSCGRTLEELCSCCRSSADRTTVLGIAKRLVNRDPEARPKMAVVLEEMVAADREKDDMVSST